nr:trihelix transcription factor GTL1 isoform X1 [Quercus suber]POE52735.1 trihelix transcription factor gt-2 [Quercus suber]
MQQEGGGSNKAQFEMSAAGANPNPMGMESSEQGGGGQLVVEAASPISSRPPASVSASAAVNLDELMPLQGDEVGDEADRAGGAAVGVGGGNRWPRQETLALLRIRSEMDAVFRDATLKGPLWEDVSRKLTELGYKRSAKKCKEKFENVHKYYKRTKEGRAGRQDGKSYKFFSELEALHSSSPGSSSAATTSNNPSPFLISPPPATTTTNPAVVSSTAGIGIISNPMPISSVRVTQASPPTIGIFPANPSASTAAMTAPVVSVQPAAAAVVRTATQLPTGISFSSNSSSSSLGTNDDDDDDEESLELEGEPSNVGSSRKRKRGSSSSSGTRRMMQFFENLMKQVMHKQEVMQQRFLEAIEKSEQDRMIRDEAWKRQEMARLAREHEVMAQDRAISASRDAAIVTFLQKITGQTIQLPTPAPPLSFPAAPPPPPVSQQAPIPTSTPAPAPAPTPTPTPTPPPSQPQQQQQQQVHQHSQNFSRVVLAVPEQQVPPQAQDIIMSGGGGSFEATSSSRWPKVEVLALIKLRSGLEQRYQEAGPKGPLWEEISARMHRMGYKRNPKRCKEKWENINKYYKKVKESNKKRPEDAKTCPYFHELDALYRKKILGGGSTSGGGGTSTTSVNQNMPQQQQETIKQDTSDAPAAAIMPTPQTQQQPLAATTASENKNGASSHVQAQTQTQTQSSNVGLPEDLFGEGIGGASKKPEDIVKELMEQQEHQRRQQLIVEDYDKIEEAESDNMDDQEEEEEVEDEDEDNENEELEVDRKLSYKIEFQRQNTGSSNGGGNGPPSFLALVQ